MFQLDSRKRQLQEAARRAQRIAAAAPAEAQALQRLARALRRDIDELLGMRLLPVSAVRAQAIEERVAGLAASAEKFRQLHETCELSRRAEADHAAELDRLGDHDLVQWFAARSRPRAELFAGAVSQASDGEAADGLLKEVDAAGRGQQVDRRLLAELSDAQRRVDAIHAPDLTGPAAETLAALRRELIAQGPRRDWVERLRAAVEPLRAFQRDRPRPPLIDDLYALLEGMGEWLDAFDDTLGGASTADADELRAITNAYWSLSDGDNWRNHPDGTFDALLERAQALEQTLRRRAAAEHGAAVLVIEANRDIFNEFGEEDLAPGLARRFGELLAQTPETPERYRRWLHDYRRANDAFEAALGGESYRLEELTAKRQAGVRDDLRAVGELPLDAADSAEYLRLHAELREEARMDWADTPVPDLIASLERWRQLAEQAAELRDRAAEKVQALESDRQVLQARMERLAELAAALDLTPGEPHLESQRATPPAGAGLDGLRAALESDHRRAADIEDALLPRCREAMAARLGAVAEARAVLEPDLDLQEQAWRTLCDEEAPHTLEQLEALRASLPDVEGAIARGVDAQLTRLLERRDVLTEGLSATRRSGLAAAERDAVEDILRRLEQVDIAGDALIRVRRLLPWIADAKRQLDIFADETHAMDERAARLNARIDRIQAELAAELRDSGTRVLLDRAWALVQPVQGVTTARAARQAQLDLADGLVERLESHLCRIAADRFAADWRQVSHLRLAEVTNLADAAADAMRLPDGSQRRQARQLAQRHRSRQEPG